MTTLTEQAPRARTPRDADALAASPKGDTAIGLLDRLERDQTPFWLMAQPMLAVAFALGLWSLTSPPLLLGWVAFLLMTTVMHWFLYQRRHRETANGATWQVTRSFMSATYGLAWSVIGCLLLAGSPGLGWQIAGAIALILSVTAPMLASNQRALMIYLVAASAPIVAFALITVDQRVHGPVAMLFAISTIVYFSVRQLNQGLEDGERLDTDARALALHLGRENTDLMARIERLREEVVADNIALTQTRQEKERAQTTLQALNEGVITTDENGVIDYMNPVAEVLTGWNVKNARGKPLSQVFTLVNRKSGEKPFISAEQSLLIERTVIGDENSTLVRRDGAEHDVEHVGSPIRDPRGRLAGAALIFRDVTERRSLQTRLTWAASLVRW